MIVVVDERESVAQAFAALLEREGVAGLAMGPNEFIGWIRAVPPTDLPAIEGFLIGECTDRLGVCRSISQRSTAVVIALCEGRSLEETLNLFASGVDDVIRKPVHIKEVLARVSAAARRARAKPPCPRLGDIVVHGDGRDPEVAGEPLILPRRELRILDYLAANVGCRVSKSQIFNAVYGLFNDEVDENVIESHISKLRKRLRSRLGYDPIESRRFLGYRLTTTEGLDRVGIAAPSEVRPAQETARHIAGELALLQD